MPLSASDVQYLNKLLDRHLKAQRAWPWARYVSLIFAAFLLMMGVVTYGWANTVGGRMDNMMQPTTYRAEPSATNPVTEAQMLKMMASSEEMLKGYAKFASLMTFMRFAFYLGAMALWLYGGRTLMGTILRWNHHRRDAILITLLREKCAAELAVPINQPTKTVP